MVKHRADRVVTGWPVTYNDPRIGHGRSGVVGDGVIFVDGNGTALVLLKTTTDVTGWTSPVILGSDGVSHVNDLVSGDETTITTLAGEIATNTSDIASLKTSRTADEGNITSLQASRTADEANIATLQASATSMQVRTKWLYA